MLIETRRKDIVWNYIGTIVSMAGGFALIPFLVHFLSEDELGLWYVYMAIANLAVLFEFGFDPTFARNIVYVVSGSKKLSSKGCDRVLSGEGVDWHFLNVVIHSAKVIYGGIALLVLIGLSTFGTAYICYVSAEISSVEIWLSWALFCVAVFFNIYFLWSLTLLRGYGDVAGESRARTYSKLIQLLGSAALLVTGMGLLGVAIGYLTSSLLLRLFAIKYLHSHSDVERERKLDGKKPTWQETREVLGAVGHVACRDGVVSFANYASTQAITIISSLFLGLAATGVFSIILQLANAIVNFAAAYPKSYYPALQSYFVQGNRKKQVEIISTGIVAYWALFVLGTFGVVAAILPLIPLLKPGMEIDLWLFLGMSIYMGLWSQHGLFCNYIVSMNEIPYMVGYLVAAIIGIGLSGLFCGAANLGCWGIVLGQAISQILYNNWKWPRYLCRKLQTNYLALLSGGLRHWKVFLAKELRHS
ncbi:O-unit flippase-like protein [Paraeggerthella sp. Marseille-Q4926]|uniref:O-unit flippase-like protein n=1 Tax=Paraeggerthella sp. Marseille-Q4926 TaxID=2866587 RepID=UPI001CE45C43|nr:O-unit flippase-like protein [Paraeggerthella sp. Marseille-Q4926]